MEQISVNNNYNSCSLKDSKFNFIPPWFKQRVFNYGSCYYCNAPSIKPILYANNPNYPLCQNCCAPAIDTVVPVQTLPALKLYNTKLAKGYLSSYPLFSQLAAVSGVTTIFTTLCLSVRQGNAWLVSLLIGGLSTAGSLTAYMGSRRFIPATLPCDSIYAVLRTLERKPELLEAIILDVAQRYNLYNIVKLLTHIHESSHDPAIIELQAIEASYKVPLANAPMQEVLAFLEKESTGILHATIDEIGQAISDNVHLILDHSTTNEDLAVIFATLSLSKKPVTLCISSNTTESFALESFTLPHSIKNLTLANISLKNLPHGFWSVEETITLDSLHGLEFLPDLPAAGLSDRPLKLSILNSSVQVLPRTITRRKIEALDLTGSVQIKSLPSNLSAQIKDGTIQTLNLTGTTVWPTYQRNFVFTEEVRKLFGEYDPQKPHELFDHRSNLITSTPVQDHALSVHHNRTLSLIYTLVLVLGVTIPLGLFFMVFERYFWNKDHEMVTDRASFWASYLAGSLLMSGAIFHGNMSAQTQPQVLCEEDIDFDAGDTILDVQALLMRQGRELLGQGIYDWDRLWIQIFQQSDPYSFKVPDALVEFINMFMDGLKGKFEGRLGKDFKRFIHYRGGRTYLTVLSALPFHKLVQTIEKDCHRFPVILDVIQTMRSAIGHLNVQYHSIHLNLEQIIETEMPVPDPDPQIMRALFSLISSGYHMDLSLNWSYDGKSQPFSFDMIPLSSNLDRLCISSAVLNDVPQDIWRVRHEIELDSVSGLQELPELPVNVPQLPLKLSLVNTTLDSLPQTLGRRPLIKLDLSNSQFIHVLPQSIKEGIVSNRIQEISLISTAVPCADQRVYAGDQLKQLLNEDIFEASTVECKTEDEDQNITFVPEKAPCADRFSRGIRCYVPNVEQTLDAMLVVGCVALCGFALWQLKVAYDNNQEKSESNSSSEEICIQERFNGGVCSTNHTGTTFDFFKHSDFPSYTKMLLGYVVQDAWLYEALQEFLQALSNMDTGQNWNCYELLYNISTKRIEFIEDQNCQKPRCRILPDCIAIRNLPGCLSNNIIAALNGQTLNLLLKDKVVLNLNLFDMEVCLTDGTKVNLRKQIVVLMYALGYTAPGQYPEDLYASKKSVCFVRRSC